VVKKVSGYGEEEFQGKRKKATHNNKSHKKEMWGGNSNTWNESLSSKKNVALTKRSALGARRFGGGNKGGMRSRKVMRKRETFGRPRSIRRGVSMKLIVGAYVIITYGKKEGSNNQRSKMTRVGWNRS